MKTDLIFIYEKLLETWGAQGWWPVIFEERKDFSDSKGYHKYNTIFDQSTTDRFEISSGAVLTQNTNWNNVYNCLLDFKQHGITTPDVFLKTDQELIKNIIRRTGYYNQKYIKLVNLVSFLQSNNFYKFPDDLSREALLELWGIGEESADSILLYAYNKKYFVIDAYTKRIVSRFNRTTKLKSYSDYQKYFTENIPDNLEIYNQFHALIVRHCVEVCRKKPICCKCILSSYCDQAV
ncbi:MAG: hypothetical protein RBT69_06825 [Spirochaetia bacterium]|jgi:endonuclease-3 related protein|nr:hypothetical protein [Spirochaetia bacterium]